MPFGLGSLGFIDDAFDSLFGGLDDLFSNKEERRKAKNELQRIKKQLKGQTLAHTEKMAQIAAQDRQQARSTQKQALNKAWWVMPTIALLSFLGFFGILFTLIFFDVPSAKQPLYIMLGALGTIVTQIAQFFFGSSEGSKRKDDRIDAAIEQAARAPTRAEAARPRKDFPEQSQVSEKDIPEKIDPAPPSFGKVGW